MRVGPGHRKDDASLGEHRHGLVQHFRARRINVHDGFRIQHKRTDRHGTLRDQLLDLFQKQISVGEVEWCAEAVDD